MLAYDVVELKIGNNGDVAVVRVVGEKGGFMEAEEEEEEKEEEEEEKEEGEEEKEDE